MYGLLWVFLLLEAVAAYVIVSTGSGDASIWTLWGALTFLTVLGLAIFKPGKSGKHR